MGVSAILKFATAPLCVDPLRYITEKYLSPILPVFLLVLLVHIAQMKAFPHSNISVISSHSEEPVANFNIANLNKSEEELLPDKKSSS